MRISDWSSDVCSSDLRSQLVPGSGTATINRYSVGVGVTSFQLDFWGRVKNLSEAARSQYFATEASERAFRPALVCYVASTYFAARGAVEQVELAEASLTSR